MRWKIDGRREYAFFWRRAGIELGALQMRDQRRLLFRVELKHPIRENLDPAHARAEFRQVRAGGMNADVLADRLNQPSDIGVISGDGTFEERSIHDGFAQRPR